MRSQSLFPNQASKKGMHIPVFTKLYLFPSIIFQLTS